MVLWNLSFGTRQAAVRGVLRCKPLPPCRVSGPLLFLEERVSGGGGMGCPLFQATISLGSLSCLQQRDLCPGPCSRISVGGYHSV